MPAPEGSLAFIQIAEENYGLQSIEDANSPWPQQQTLPFALAHLSCPSWAQVLCILGVWSFPPNFPLMSGSQFDSKVINTEITLEYPVPLTINRLLEGAA